MDGEDSVDNGSRRDDEKSNIDSLERSTAPARSSEKWSKETVFERESIWPSSFPMTDNPAAAREREKRYQELLTREGGRRRVLIPGTGFSPTGAPQGSDPQSQD